MGVEDESSGSIIVVDRERICVGEGSFIEDSNE